ncbi:MAG: protein-L-isoaspartate(D-aspartate) O-methyltransferase [Polyangiaceae bacterium]|nr:protein-L-isoaspartate(D-aspartate) O-methyltransferase [Polyangiaceae bacterium]
MLEQFRARGVDDERVLAAMGRVPRHLFVPAALETDAYADRPLPIGGGQTISQPYIVALMTEAARPGPRDRCLDVGTGSGYQAAVLAELCGETFSVELLPAIAAFGAENLRRAGPPGDTVRLRVGDGWAGWPEAAPFDVIVVTAAPERVPPPLLEQLAIGGRLIVPVGRQDSVQVLERWTRLAPGAAGLRREELTDVRFVPLVSDAGR